MKSTFLLIGELWEKIVKKRFPKHQREEMETYRELYERYIKQLLKNRYTYLIFIFTFFFCRMIEEEKEKLDRLMGKVQNSYHSIKTNNKQTKLAYVDEVAKPPRGVKRAQVTQCGNY